MRARARSRLDPPQRSAGRTARDCRPPSAASRSRFRRRRRAGPVDRQDAPVEQADVKRTLASLGHRGNARGRRSVRRPGEAQGEGRLRPAGAELMATQDRIIDALRKLLDVTRQAEAEVLAEMKKRPGGDLPDDVEAEARRGPRQARRVPQAAEEGDRGQREPGQDAGRGFHRGGGAVAQGPGRRRGRLVEVHEGTAHRPEQAARAGFRQRRRWPRNWSRSRPS